MGPLLDGMPCPPHDDVGVAGDVAHSGVDLVQRETEKSHRPTVIVQLTLCGGRAPYRARDRVVEADQGLGDPVGRPVLPEGIGVPVQQAGILRDGDRMRDADRPAFEDPVTPARGGFPSATAASTDRYTAVSRRSGFSAGRYRAARKSGVPGVRTGVHDPVVDVVEAGG